MGNLKTCPFCVGQAHYKRTVSRSFNTFLLVECDVCHAQTQPEREYDEDPEGFDREAAITVTNRWNLRVDERN